MSLNDPVAPAVATEPQAAVADLPSRFACFVTGTDTGVGKTLVSCAILNALVKTGVRACGMKPVAAGAVARDGVELCNDDAESLIGAGNVVLPPKLTTPYLLREPVAPHIAADLEDIEIELIPILEAYAGIRVASDAVVVEGIGGFCVPLSESFDTADLAEELGLPVIMVVGLRLGCLNHALLTAQAISARGLKLAGWIANEIDPEMRFIDENIEALLLHLPAPMLGRVPRLKFPTAASAADCLDLAGLPGWPRANEPT